jgi:hypothetical protein
LLHISFADDPKGSLGTQLINCDKDETASMFLPGYAVVGKLVEGDTVARRAGVRVGDCIIAVNGHGFRRFKPDYKEEELVLLNEEEGGQKVEVDMDHAVVPAPGYDSLLAKIKAVKAAGGDPPLVLSLERYGWDARANSWGRFLAARDNKVPEAMAMQQQHEIWRDTTFPIDLHSKGLQTILKQKAVCEIDVDWGQGDDFPPTVYVNYGKLLALQTAGDITVEDVVQAFVIFTERMLAKAADPRHPSTCQFIDLSGVSITSGFRVDTLKQIYKTFEPNYPETLYKMVLYPVSSIMVRCSGVRDEGLALSLSCLTAAPLLLLLVKCRPKRRERCCRS